ncbi:AMP-binding protein [Jannaschia formosa]|uniref:AMP-binding protein n=1 Tax=Jannaschia formosa TaxID=2259592 RepID=UPI000E1C12CF|nr:AMP-binding protein [Jannaschia formosa]TFL17853.1 AMP-dependent synthetase [Jannaschia formosa]
MPPPGGTVRDWIDRRAAETPDAPAYLFVDGGPALTWAGLRDAARAVASGLMAIGVSKGESVAIVLPNGREAITAFFGATYGGFRATQINLVAGASAIGYALGHSEARVALVNDETRRMLAEVAAAEGLALDARTVAEVAGLGAPDAVLPELAAGDDCMLMYTSGTTGRPKGVLHSQASLLAGGWTATVAHGLTAEDRALCVLPLYHINGLGVTVMGPLVSGGSSVICPRFSASRFWTHCAEHEVTWFSVVPTIISHLIHGEDGPDAATRGRIRFARSASAALAPEVQIAFERRFEIPIVETMGLTETAPQILSNPLPPGTRKIGSPGRAWGNEVAILSPELVPIRDGSEGEIAVRGPNVMRCYFKNAEATEAAVTPDGWFRTGDLGRMDADGYVFVTGRLKELIIKGGENIAPREVDEALHAHPDVIEAAAFARPSPRYGETVEAAVKLKPRSTASEADLKELCLARLGAFKSPDRIHLLDELPKGPSGKIQRLKLLEWADARAEAASEPLADTG